MRILDRLWRQKDWVQHVVVALAIQLAWAVIVGAVGLWVGHWCLPFVVGAIAASHQFYGREQRDHENKVTADYDNPRGWNPFGWGSDERSDFLWPAGATCGLALLVEVGRVWWG